METRRVGEGKSAIGRRLSKDYPQTWVCIPLANVIDDNESMMSLAATIYSIVARLTVSD